MKTFYSFRGKKQFKTKIYLNDILYLINDFPFKKSSSIFETYIALHLLPVNPHNSIERNFTVDTIYKIFNETKSKHQILNDLRKLKKVGFIKEKSRTKKNKIIYTLRKYKTFSYLSEKYYKSGIHFDVDDLLTYKKHLKHYLIFVAIYFLYSQKFMDYNEKIIKNLGISIYDFRKVIKLFEIKKKFNNIKLNGELTKEIFKDTLSNIYTKTIQLANTYFLKYILPDEKLIKLDNNDKIRFFKYIGKHYGIKDAVNNHTRPFCNKVREQSLFIDSILIYKNFFNKKDFLAFKTYLILPFKNYIVKAKKYNDNGWFFTENEIKV